MPEIPLGPGPRRMTGAMVSNPDFASPYVSDSFSSGSGIGSGIDSGIGSGSDVVDSFDSMYSDDSGGRLIPSAVGPKDKTLWNWDHIPGYEGDRDPYDWMRTAKRTNVFDMSSGGQMASEYRTLPAQLWRGLASEEGYMVPDKDFVEKYGEDVYGPEGFKWSPEWNFREDRPAQPGDETFTPFKPPDFPIDFTPDDSYLPWWMLDGPGSSAF